MHAVETGISRQIIPRQRPRWEHICLSSPRESSLELRETLQWTHQNVGLALYSSGQSHEPIRQPRGPQNGKKCNKAYLPSAHFGQTAEKSAESVFDPDWTVARSTMCLRDRAAPTCGKLFTASNFAIKRDSTCVGIRPCGAVYIVLGASRPCRARRRRKHKTTVAALRSARVGPRTAGKALKMQTVAATAVSAYERAVSLLIASQTPTFPRLAIVCFPVAMCFANQRSYRLCSLCQHIA